MLEVADRGVLERVASLLQVAPAALASSLVTRKVASGRGSSYAVPLTMTQCVDTRDALAKAIYTNQFDWLIARLNEHMKSLATARVDEEHELFVGLLDVFGFEVCCRPRDTLNGVRCVQPN